MHIGDISPYVDRHARHRLLFVQGVVEGISYVDVGRELSVRIGDRLGSRQLPMLCDDALNAIIDSATRHDLRLGSYVALRNIGILFELALMVNVHDKLEQYARDRVLIVNLEGTITGQVFYLGQERSSQYSVQLKDITHHIIYDNI